MIDGAAKYGRANSVLLDLRHPSTVRKRASTHWERECKPLHPVTISHRTKVKMNQWYEPNNMGAYPRLRGTDICTARFRLTSTRVLLRTIVRLESRAVDNPV